MPQFDELHAARITALGIFENFFRLKVEKTKAHGAMAHDALQMPASAAAAVFFSGIERDHHVAAFPDAFVPGINAEADAVTEGPDTGKPVELSARGGQARGYNVGV